MHKIDSSVCIGCGSCASTCPVEAISRVDNGDYYVVGDACIDCGSCEGDCPVEAIAFEG